MALSAAERKRLQIEREKAHARRQLDLTYALPRPDFGAWLAENAGEEMQHLTMCYDGMNRTAPDFSADTDPVSLTGHFVYPATEDGTPSYRGALGRAELELDLLLEAAKTLAAAVNAYKRKVIADRIATIEAEDLSDPETRRQRLAEIVFLNKALERLDKSVRTDVPQWQLRG